jgi:hypothetical protein
MENTEKKASLTCLFDSPIKAKKVRNGVTAYQYRNGVINICGIKYQGYSMTKAIIKFRKNYKTN